MPMMTEKTKLIQACDNKGTVVKIESEFPKSILGLAERKSIKKALDMRQATKIRMSFLQ